MCIYIFGYKYKVEPKQRIDLGKLINDIENPPLSVSFFSWFVDLLLLISNSERDIF